VWQPKGVNVAQAVRSEPQLDREAGRISGMRADDPVVAAKKVKLKTTGHRTCTEGDIAAVRRRWTIESPHRLAM
jgi:hypothetical protein